MLRATDFPHFTVRRRRSAQQHEAGTMVVGTDLVWIPEVANSVSRFGQRYLNKLFSVAELRDCEGIPERRYASLAARFAAKEAVMKILGLHADQAIPWRAIEVIRPRGTSPSIRLHEPAIALAKQAGIHHCALSMSHDHDYATATVIATRSLKKPTLRCSKTSPSSPFH